MAANAPPTPPAPTRSTLIREPTPSKARARRSGNGGTSVDACLLPDVAHDVLDPRVVLEAVHRQVLAVAAVLEAAVGHLRDDRDVGVDPDRAEVELLRHPHGPSVVLGPDAGGEPVV